MSFSRAAIVCIQAALYQLASTPPNKAPAKGRYATDEVFFSKIAPLVFKIQQPLIWLCTLADVLLILTQQTIIPLSSSATSAIRSTICPSPSTQPVSATVAIHTTSFLLIGALLVVSGSLLRLTCYRTLGAFFTFELAILPAHRLIASGPYSVIRHPAYTGSLLMLMGLALANLSPGGWVAECGIFGRGSGSLVVRVGFFRCGMHGGLQ
ncbi:hypothetical protein A0H81_10995 [Grifola frondosa]|uniref:Protein-S-isoprenylcysteine O-methyltransferase n=1 Tax=Grifola frondosa TaxID=5627 RepID=A0A1C7LXQ7_GRIFR|nr:hypothetical protein A0H81_10995 [Grifola frondosa]